MLSNKGNGGRLNKGSAYARLLMRVAAERERMVRRALRELDQRDTADGLGDDAPLARSPLSPEARLWKAVWCKAFDDFFAAKVSDPRDALLVEAWREDARQFLYVRVDEWTKKVFDRAGVDMVEWRSLSIAQHTAKEAA